MLRGACLRANVLMLEEGRMLMFTFHVLDLLLGARLGLLLLLELYPMFWIVPSSLTLLEIFKKGTSLVISQLLYSECSTSRPAAQD